MKPVSNNQPLAGRTILVAHPRGAELPTNLERHGARVILSPTVELSPPESYSTIDEAIENLYGYDWLIFTNANAVEYFLRRFQALGRDLNELDALRTCAIGEATARKLEGAQVHADLIPAQFGSETIFSALVAYIEGAENLTRLNFLIPRAAIARDRLAAMLADAGARVDIVVAYRAVPLNREITSLNALLAGGGIDCIVFAGPESVQNLAQLFDANDLSEVLKGVAVACIGDATVLAASRYCLKTDIMPAPTALGREIAAHFQVDVSQARS